MNPELTIDPEFEAFCPPLSDEEFTKLHTSVMYYGCIDPIRTWNGTIIDGHNRYKICQKFNRPFTTKEVADLHTREDVFIWMYNNQMARRNLTDFQRVEFALKVKPHLEAKAREHARAERQAQIQAIVAMRKYWNSLPMLRGNHPYLEKKGLSNRGCSNLRIDGDKLAIPMFKRGQLMSVQTIAPDGSKKFRFRCPVKETTYELKRPRSMFTCLCEGFATGLTLYQSIPTASVVVCFNSSNLVDVAKTRTTAGMTVICADNDHKTTGNPGITKGKEAAEILRCGLAYPEGISGTDWDDARQEWGEGAYARIRAEVMRSAKMVT